MALRRDPKTKAGIPYVEPSPEFTKWWRAHVVDLYTPAYDAARAAFAAGLEIGERRRALEREAK